MTPLVKFQKEQDEKLLPKWAAILTILFGVVGVILSFLSLSSHLKAVTFGPVYQSFCNINQTVNCDSVARSDWGNIFGFPLPAITLIFYLITILFGVGSLITRRIRALDIQFIVMLFVMFISLFLLYISLFHIKALCILCFGMDVVNFILLLVAYLGGERGVTFGERIFQGIKGTLELPIAILGVGDYSESSESTVTLAGFLLGLVTVFMVIYGTLRQGNVLKRTHISQFSAEMYEKEVKRVVNEWKDARVEDLSIVTSDIPQADFIAGPKDAPIKIVEFSDFQCPHCRVVATVVEEAIKGYEDKVAFINKAYPLDPICNVNISGSGHPEACRAAKYARCTGEQGKFWQAFHSLNKLDALSIDSGVSDVDFAIRQDLKGIGVDPVKLRDCFDSERQMGKTRADIALGDKIGVKGTPSFFINGKKIKGIEIKTLRMVFDEILKSQAADSPVTDTKAATASP